MAHIYKTMKIWSLALIALLIALPAFAQETVDVSFVFNAATVYANVNPTDWQINLNGNIKGQGAPESGDATFIGGETLGWGSAGTAILNHVGGDYWKATYQMYKGDTLLYKFRISTDGGINQDDYEFQPSENPSGWGTRGLIAVNDTMVVTEFFNNVNHEGISESERSTVVSTRPFVSDADSLTIWFRVNVGRLVQEQKFDPAVHQVGVRGVPAFIGNPDDWSSAGFYLSQETKPSYVSANSPDVFYSGALKLHRDSVTAGDEFRFQYVPEMGEVVGWEDGGDRNVVIPANDTTFQYAFHSRQAPSTETLYTSNVEFRVNTQMLEALGLFSSQLDEVQFRGGPNGWGGAAMDFDSESRDFNYLLSSWVHAEAATIGFKYYISYDESRQDVNSANYIQAVEADVDFGYEEPANSGGSDRVYSLGTDQAQSTGITSFNDISLASVIQQDMSVTFEIDMNSAITASEPFNPATDSVYLRIESKVLAFTQKKLDDGYDWIHGGAMFEDALTPSEIEFLRFIPVAGETNVYRLTLDLKAPFVNDFGYIIGFGSAISEVGLTYNGGGFGPGRRYYQFIDPISVEDGGINPLLGQVFDVTWPESVTLDRVSWKQEDLPFETQPNYAVLADVSEPVNNLPTSFKLEQNYPNPFNPTTNIAFNIPTASQVTLEVYNMLGQRVATLLNRQLSAGSHLVPFSAANLGSGIYIYRLTAGNFVDTRRMTLIK
jgi:hypothetical protein